MKKIILAAVAALGLASAASAATYSVDVTAHPFREAGAPGLQTRAWILEHFGAQNFGGPTGNTPTAFSFNLTNLGDSQDVDLFGLVHFDAPLNADDLIHSPSSVTLKLGAFGTHTINGETYGVGTVGQPFASAFAHYLNTVSFNIGGGLRVIASLHDTAFGADSIGTFTNGLPGFGKVTATFTLAAVPLPATLPLGLAGLGLLGFVARRRKGASLI